MQFLSGLLISAEKFSDGKMIAAPIDICIIHLIAAFLAFAGFYECIAQPPAIIWQKSLGGSGIDQGYSIVQTTDGGFIMTGRSNSNNGDVWGNNGDTDFWVVKLTSSGDTTWTRSLGGSAEDVAWSVKQTFDGGYIVAGRTASNNGDVHGNHGGEDFWVVKLNSSGDTVWTKCLGGTDNDRGDYVIQTSDSGYAIAGLTYSNDGDVSGNPTSFSDFWVVKLGKTGNILWQKSLGGNANDGGNVIQQTSDGGYIVVGFTLSSATGEVSESNNGSSDYWVVKLDGSGNIIWDKTFGGSGVEDARSVEQTSDGGYIVAGTTGSNNGDVHGNHGGLDYWVIKLNSTGDTIWTKTLGGSNDDEARFVRQVNDGGYIVAGSSKSSNGDVTVNRGGYDFWVVKLDENGNLIWQKSSGSSLDDGCYFALQLGTLEYVFAGFSQSNDGDVTGNHGGSDYWVVKMDTCFKLTWTGAMDDEWLNNANWDYGFVPTPCNDVDIPNVTPHPVVRGFGVAQAKTITIFPSAQLTVTAINNTELEIYGDLISGNNPSNLGPGKVSFRGGDQTIAGEVSTSGLINVMNGATLHTGGYLTIESGGSLLHGEDTPGSGGDVDGDITIKRTGTSSSVAYNFWSSPVVNQDVSVIGGTRYYYEPANALNLTVAGLRQAWVSAAGNMNMAKGYISTGGGTVSFTGEPGNAPTGSPISIDITKPQIPSTEYNPWNLIGNPFPCALDGEVFQNVNGPAGTGVITGSIYLWDDDNSGGAGWDPFEDYATYNLTGINPRFEPSLQLTSFNGFVASGQSFFVEKVNTGTDPVTFSNAMRSDGDNNSFFKRQGMQRIYLGIINPNGIYNEALIAFSDFTTDTFDMGFDSKKLKGNSQIAFGTKLNDDCYSIQAFGKLSEDKIIPLYIDAAATGNYKMRLMGIEYLDETVSIILEDIELGARHNFRLDSVYEFALTASQNIDRFLLHLNAVMEIAVSDESCNGNDGFISLNQPGGKSWDYSLELNGSLLANGTGLNGYHEFSGLSAGTYMLALGDSEGYEVLKTFAVMAKQGVIAGFQAPQYTDANHPVQFSNSSSGATRYEWDFGDGAPPDTAYEPTHSFNMPGTYTITLSAMNDDCASQHTGILNVIELATDIAQTGQDEMNVYSREGFIIMDLNFGLPCSGALSIHDALGKQVAFQQVITEGVNKIDFRDKPMGCYYLHLNTSEARLSKKIMFNR